MEVKLNVNGAQHKVEVDPAETLLVTLRDQLELYGTREGCGIGICGACTVLVDGQPMCGCLMLTPQAEDSEITTIEGLGADDNLHPVQQAYIEEAAYQCAFCTSGFILSTVALLEVHPQPNDETIREYLAGNLCRCGSYRNILAAVKKAAADR